MRLPAAHRVAPSRHRYRRFESLREQYARFKGDDQTPIEARCSGKPTMYDRPETGIPGLNKLAGKVQGTPLEATPVGWLARMFGREYEAVDPECRAQFRRWADRSHGHPKAWISDGAERDRAERDMILRPAKVPAPPGLRKAASQPEFGSFQPYEQPPPSGMGSQVYPSNYFQAYHPPQEKAAIY